MSDKQNWDNGWQAGFNWAYSNSYVTVNYKLVDGKKVYSGSISGGWEDSGQEVMDRSDMFQRGYREGLMSGYGRYWDDNKEKILKQLEIWPA